jgi:hypothetical protein
MSLDVIQARNHLASDLKFNEAKEKILKRIEEFPNIQKYRNDIEFLLLVCNLIEHLIIKKDKVDKKELLLDIYKKVFNVDSGEISSLSKNIDFLLANGKIKKVSAYKLFKTGIKELLFKRFR